MVFKLKIGSNKSKFGLMKLKIKVFNVGICQNLDSSVNILVFKLKICQILIPISKCCVLGQNMSKFSLILVKFSSNFCFQGQNVGLRRLVRIENDNSED